MQWFGKAIGALIGAVAGPWGAVAGMVLGHQVDMQAEARKRGPSAHAISQLFFEVAFEVMGRVAKSDGRVSEDEIRVARQIMHGMKLSPELTDAAIAAFTRGKSQGYELDDRVRALAAQIGTHVDLARAFVQLQLQAAVGAGAVDSGKRELIAGVARKLGVSRTEVAQIEAVVRGLGRQSAAPAPTRGYPGAYAVLGIEPSASDEEVKTAYRRLMSQHHPDKLVARGLPESMRSVADQKTQEVRAAYEAIKTQRGLK